MVLRGGEPKRYSTDTNGNLYRVLGDRVLRPITDGAIVDSIGEEEHRRMMRERRGFNITLELEEHNRDLLELAGHEDGVVRKKRMGRPAGAKDSRPRLIKFPQQP